MTADRRSLCVPRRGRTTFLSGSREAVSGEVRARRRRPARPGQRRGSTAPRPFIEPTNRRRYSGTVARYRTCLRTALTLAHTGCHRRLWHDHRDSLYQSYPGGHVTVDDTRAGATGALSVDGTTCGSSKRSGTRFAPESPLRRAPRDARPGLELCAWQPGSSLVTGMLGQPMRCEPTTTVRRRRAPSTRRRQRSGRGSGDTAVGSVSHP